MADPDPVPATIRDSRVPGEFSPGATGRLRLCTTCDEPFAPRYYRVCHGCGFDFGEGVVLEHRRLPELLSPRARFTAAALLLVFFGVVTYFWWLLR